ncbi:unnamed protein product [Schistosoma curassoni]|uniref:Uncharacterized protein n=1 Tax=Schistosoma curassoni TaxID=6186 RepID=A0A183KAW3_9TREM|nr:unnamed protein product [Schistosoma curassoni]
MFNTVFFRDTKKLNEFNIALNNRSQALQDLLEEEATTMEDNWKAGKYGKPDRSVKDKKGKTITDVQEQRNRWVDYSEELLNKPAPLNPPDIETAPTDLPIDVTPPTIEEIKMTIRQIKCGKAAGPDIIPAEALKSDVEVTASMIHTLFGKIWEEERVPMTD